MEKRIPPLAQARGPVGEQACRFQRGGHVGEQPADALALCQGLSTDLALSSPGQGCFAGRPGDADALAGDLHAAAVQHLHGELESRAFGPDARILRNLAIEGETEHVTAFQSHGFSGPDVPVIVAAGGFNLDDLGAHIGEQRAAERSCQYPREIQYAQTFQGSRLRRHGNGMTGIVESVTAVSN